MSKHSKADIQASFIAIREALSKCAETRNGKPVIRTVLRHVSASGMRRDISVHVVVKDADGSIWVQNLSWHVARAIGWPVKDTGAAWSVRVAGAGMDMGYHLVETFMRASGLSLDFLHDWM